MKKSIRVKLSSVGISLVLKFWDTREFSIEGFKAKLLSLEDYFVASLPLGCDPLSAWEERGFKNQEHLPVKEPVAQHPAPMIAHLNEPQKRPPWPYIKK